MKAVCMVAHPDDCVIFGWSLMHHFRNLAWTVTYLTYEHDHARAREFSRYWSQKQILTRFLGFVDDYRDIESGQPSFDTDLAQRAIHDSVREADVILTHDADGDYGHPHHRFVNQCVQRLCHDHVITFAQPGKGTHDYTVGTPDYTADVLPMHHGIIKSFHPNQHTNSYRMSATTLHRIANA